jgi:serine/threonine protein kinase
VKYLII